MTLNSTTLRDALLRTLERHQVGLVREWKAWLSGDSGAVARFTLEWKQVGGIYTDLADTLGLDYELEHTYAKRPIDAVFYRRPRNPSDSFAMAFEHESKSSTAYDEIEKLSKIDAPISVMVTYPPKNRIAKHLDSYATMLGQAEEISGLFVVVFGCLVGDVLEWNCYEYDGVRFAPIP